MPNENDNKIVTLADLGVAYNNLNTNKKNIQTAVPDPTASGTDVSFIASISQDAQGVITATKKTVSEATTSAAGLMSATDKTKLNSIESGAAVASVNGATGAVVLDAEDVGALPSDTVLVTGIKGFAETGGYRTGNVEITSSNIGAISKWGGDYGIMTGYLSLRDGDGMGDIPSTSGGHLQFLRGSDGKKMAFVCTNTNTVYFEILRDPGNENGGREGYALPTPTQTSGWAGYDILTTKDARTKLGLVPTSVNVTQNTTITQSGITGTGIRVIRYGNVVTVSGNIKLNDNYQFPSENNGLWNWYTIYSGLPKSAFSDYCHGILRFDSTSVIPATVLISTSGYLQISPRGANINGLRGLLSATYICAN